MLGNVLISSPCFLFGGVEFRDRAFYRWRASVVFGGRRRWEKERRGTERRSRWVPRRIVLEENRWVVCEGSTMSWGSVPQAIDDLWPTFKGLWPRCEGAVAWSKISDFSPLLPFLPTDYSPSFSIPLLFPVSSSSHLSKFTNEDSSESWDITRVLAESSFYPSFSCFFFHVILEGAAFQSSELLTGFKCDKSF